jgi:hypothetical protein
MHRSRIVRTGDTFTLELPRQLLRETGLGEGDEVGLGQTEHGFAVFAIDATDELIGEIDPEFARQTDAFIDKYRDALKSLAQR